MKGISFVETSVEEDTAYIEASHEEAISSVEASLEEATSHIEASHEKNLSSVEVSLHLSVEEVIGNEKNLHKLILLLRSCRY